MKTVWVYVSALLFATSAWADDVSRAKGLYQRTEYQQALNVLKNQQSPDALALSGKSAFMLGDFKRAVEFFDRATQSAPQSSEYWHWLGKSHGRRAETSSFLVAPKHANECRKAFEKAVEIDPNNLEAWNDLLEYYLEAPGFLGGGADKASIAAKKIGSLDPVERHFAEARLAEKRKEYSTAEQHLRRASELAPQQIGRVLDLARFFAKQGRIQESEMAFRKAEQISPESPKLLFARAEVYIHGKRNLPAAKQMLEQYLKAPLTPDDPPKQEAERLLRIASGS